MTLIICAIFLVGLILLATPRLHKLNAAAVAIFLAAICWVLYLIQADEYIMALHGEAFQQFLNGRTASHALAKQFVAQTIFSHYVAVASGVVLFLLATMNIVEILHNNGCFDFLTAWMRTRSPKRLMWTLAAFTFLLSANLDNLTTAVLMLTLMHTLVASDRLRRIYGFVIVMSVACGGAMTVIGDVTSLTLWTEGLVTPTAYSLMLALPCIAALATTLLLLMPKLPSRLELASTAGAYRGDDNLLPAWQRFMLLFIGIGGLWFIPTFHHLTQLPPFVGALCVVAVLWVVNELCNRKLMFSDRMSRRRFPTALQYANVQNMMLFTGLILSIAAVRETGALDTLASVLAPHGGHMYLSGVVHGVLGALVGNVTALIGGLAVFNTPSFTETIPEAYAAEGIFWPWLSLCTSLGGAMLLGGTVAGIFFERMEKAPLSWYLRHCSPRVFVGWVVAAVVFFAQTFFI